MLAALEFSSYALFCYSIMKTMTMVKKVKTRLCRLFWDVRNPRTSNVMRCVFDLPTVMAFGQPRGMPTRMDDPQRGKNDCALTTSKLKCCDIISYIDNKTQNTPPSLTGEAACPSEMVCCSTSSSSVLWWITHVRSGGPQPRPEAASFTKQVSLHCHWCTLVR
jgi:hypothetical protein